MTLYEAGGVGGLMVLEGGRKAGRALGGGYSSGKCIGLVGKTGPKKKEKSRKI